MKLDLPAIDIQRSSNFQQANFEIGDPRIIFNILRSKMYSRPVYVICQEIMSNSRDANRESGRGEKPVEVVLPSWMNDQIQFIDNGPGISPDRMQNIYLRYGNSTKRADNSQTGGFGLGAKTPFAYSDSFNITTITEEDGKRRKRTYVAFIDETQKGAVTLTHEEDTEEDTGTTISMAVKKQDMKEFAAAIKTIGTFWNPRPIVKGGDNNFEFPLVEYQVEGTGWSMTQYSPLDISAGATIIIDGIPYGVRPAAIFPSGHAVHNDADAGIMKRMVDSRNVILKFNVGELAVTANREDLDYQPDVIKKIHDRLRIMVTEARKSASEKLKNAKTLWEATITWNKCRDLFSNFGIKGRWNNFDLLPSPIDFYSDREYDYKGSQTTKVFEGKEDVKVSVFDLDENGMVQLAKYRSYRRTSPIRSISVDTHYKVVEDLDSNEKPDRARVQSILDKGGISKVAVVSFNSPEARAWIEKKYHWTLWGNERLEDYPRAPKAIVKRGGGYKIHKVKKFTAGNRAEWVADPTKTTADATGGIYVLLESGLIKPGKGMKAVSKDRLREIKALLGNAEIYGFLAKWAKKDINPAWRPLADVLREKERELRNCPEVQHVLHFGIKGDIYSYVSADALEGLIKDKDLPAGDFKLWLDGCIKYRKFAQKTQKLNEVRAILGKAGITYDEGIGKWLYKRCSKKYPMLFHLDRYKSTSETKKMVKDIVNYVKLVDSKGKD